jgi:multidrug transporter EmrE-like cation transporter
VKTYLVFEPEVGPRTPAEAERVLFLREKFSWPAFFFGPLWLLWHRLWLGLAFWIAATALIAAALAALHLGTAYALLGALLLAFVLGFEATELRRQRLVASGLREAGVVLAADIESAERSFFSGWLERGGAERPPPAATPPLGPPRQVIGFFPDPGAIR